MITQNEFLFVIRWTMPELAGYVRRFGKNYSALIEFRKNLQRALAAYSRKNHGNGKMDAVQDKAIAIIEKITKWMKLAYMQNKQAELIRFNPELALNPKKTKKLARIEWEKFDHEQRY